MTYKIVFSKYFQTNVKYLVKKYPSLKKEIHQLVANLKTNPKQGTLLNKDLYKIRLSIASKGKGKSGGARVITLVQVTNTTVVLLTIYSKGEIDMISEVEIKKLIRKLEQLPE